MSPVKIDTTCNKLRFSLKIFKYKFQFKNALPLQEIYKEQKRNQEKLLLLKSREILSTALKALLTKPNLTSLIVK